ncbi:MAG: PF20097 family protein [Thermoplasmata archaeon]
METSVSTSCPKCGQTMEPGFSAENSLMFWQREPNTLVFPLWKRRELGEQLTVRPVLTQNLPGFRCRACRILVLDYSAVANPDVQ